MEALIAAVLPFLSGIGSTLASSGVLALLAKVAPALDTSGVSMAINILQNVLGPAIKLTQQEFPIISSIIDDLKGANAVTADQMAALDALDAQCDAQFDVAVAAAEAADKAAG